jgi:acetyl-CoA carboxylase carboxyltransferase component
MIWEPELEELRRREGLARRMGGEERVARQHASGRLTVRERIDRLFDDGSFHETGALAGRVVYRDDGELDRGSVFELGAAFGRSTTTCLARLGGRPVGVLSTTAAGLRPTPPTRWRALWTPATSSTCPS